MSHKNHVFLLPVLIVIATATAFAVVRLAGRTEESVTVDDSGTPATSVGSVPPDGEIRAIRIDPASGSQKVRDSAKNAVGGSPTNELACEDAGGAWNGCGSACRDKPSSEMCVQVCVEYCECSSSGQCPNEENTVSRLTCMEFVNGTGVCKKL